MVCLQDMFVSYWNCDWRQQTRFRERRQYHETQIPPLVQEIPVYINTVGLAQVFGYEGADGG